jgi:8-amino-7-oxononanoate synthase
MLDRMAAELARLRAADQFRDLTIPAGIPLGSNDYLGLSTHPKLREAIACAVQEDERVASTGSRLLSGNHGRWEQLESEFAEFLGVEAALYFSSGYAANIGLLSSILRPEDTVFSDASNHASLIDGIRLSNARKVIFPHLDLVYLEDSLRRDAGKGRRVVVVESIFSMEGDRAPLADITKLCERFNASLIVDEAHAVGVEGLSGRGLVPDGIFASVYPCGKALAAMGGFVVGSRTLRDFLINHARPFIFSTALPPYCGSHIRTALALVRQADAERAHLRELSRYFRERLSAAEFDIGRSNSQIVPLILGSNETAIRFAKSLSEAGFAIRAVRPPTVPAGTARLRISLNAGLSTANMDALVDALAACNRKFGAIR